MYFDMVRLYGKSYDLDKNAFGVPNVTTPLKSSAQPLRNTVSENYNQILSDLKAAAPLLAKTKSNGFVNYYGNLAMQARVYPYEGLSQCFKSSRGDYHEQRIYAL